jgi:hypothetical protein
MTRHLSRRRVLVAGGAVLAAEALPGLGRTAAADTHAAGPSSDLPAAFPQQDPDLVRETVGASHGRFDRVRELVEAQPALAKATWDWGFGDWESALGAAAHTGQREIALFLLAHGARLDVFAAAMLGWLPAVRALIEAQPELVRTPGPHSIPLLRHAEAGGEPARGVRDYVESLGVDAGPPAEPLPEGALEALTGSYAAGGGGPEFEIGEQRGGLTLQTGPGFPRGLAHRGGLLFQVAGAEAVTVRFERDGGGARLTLVDGPLRIVAARSAPAGR